MTPNPNSPAFIIHEVPGYACDNSKRLSQYFFQLREVVMKNRWQGISVDDVSLSYNTYNGCTELKIIFYDRNRHTHQFIMQLVPDNGFGDGEDSFRLLYFFDGVFDENVVSVRSFAEYLAIYLEWEAFDAEVINCGKGIEIPCKIDYCYEAICRLIDITLSKLKPIEWFYSKEIKPSCFNDLLKHFTEVASQLKDEARKGRWTGISPECIKLGKYDDEECCIIVKYVLDDIWEWWMHIDSVWCEIDSDGCRKYADLCYCLSYHPCRTISEKERKRQDNMFAEFLEAIPTAKGNLYLGCGSYEHYMDVTYFHLEETFNLFSQLLDIVSLNLKRFNLHNGHYKE